MTIATGTIISLALTAASTVYQQQQAKKAKRKAKQAADARKGFEIVKEGNAEALPVVYGRALVGGVRVYHSTNGNYIHTASNADKSFVTGPPGYPAGSFTEHVMNIESGEYEEKTVTYDGQPDGLLNKTINGAKNEFLFFQQALCQGPIHSVQDVIFDGSRFLDDPSLGTYSGTETNWGRVYDSRKAKAALRVDCHYDGGVADAIMTANDHERSDARFTGVSYATVVIRLDRDDPQFNGVPDVQFLVEGRLVRRVVNGTLLQTRFYSNNPAWCLLDYLLDDTYGKALTEADVDLASFEAAAGVCDMIVRHGALVGGKIFQPTDGSRNITHRDLPLYECNIVIDVTKPLRDNVEAILETMGDARLVWSQGKYKLLLQYPGVNNAGLKVATTITDDDLVLGEQVDIMWPSSEDRLNYCNVRFHNETENFKEDSVGWPPKVSETYVRGFGGFKYTPVSGWGTKQHEQFLNTYAVWSGQGQTTHMEWRIVPRVGGSFTLRYVFDQSGTISIGGQSFNSGSGIQTRVINLNANTEYFIGVDASNNKGLKGVAATLTGPDGLTVWTTRSDSYSSFEVISISDAVYKAMLTEDNDTRLEADIFVEGITDYYHALAKAEAEVRRSRSAFSVAFTYVVRDKYLEPGDVIKLSSETLKIGLQEDLHLKVDDVEMKDDGTCRVTGTRFHWTQLAWNVDDNEYRKPGSAYDFKLPAPAELRYVTKSDKLYGSSGQLEWDLVADPRVVGYRLYVHEYGEKDDAGTFQFVELGNASNPPFPLPYLLVTNAVFGVRSVTATGSMSRMTTTSVVVLMPPAPPTVSDLAAVVTGDHNESVKLTWTVPALRDDETPYNDHFTSFVYRSKTNDVSTAVKIGESKGPVAGVNEFYDTPTEYDTLYYWVKLVSYKGTIGAASNAASVVVDFWEGEDDLTPPPAPTNLTVHAALNVMILSWDIPVHTVGGGHYASLIYAAEWPQGMPEPVFTQSRLVASVVGSVSMYNFPTSLGKRWVFWVKEQSRGRGISEGYAGPAWGQTGLVGGEDLAPLIIEAGHIKDGGITAQKFIPGIEAVVNWTEETLPTEFVGNIIVWDGDHRLYTWDGTKYVIKINAVEIDGQIIASQIADAAITTAKFAQDITPVEIVAALPSSGNFKGRSVFLTSDNKIYRHNGTAWTAAVSTVDLVGTVTSAQIANAAITTAKFASGLTPVEVVSSLPTSGNFNGRVVFLTTDGKIYRHTGTAWTASVPAGDLTGQLTDAQIASIAAAKMTGQITSTQISDNAITTPKISAGAVTAGTLAAGSVLSDKIAANAVTAAKIEAGAIDASKLTAGAVTAGKIAAGAVNTTELAANAVNASKIAAGAITAEKVAANAITAEAIAADSVTSAKIAAGAVTASELAADAVTAGKIAAGAVNAREIAASAVSADKIAASAVTSDKLAANAVTAGKISAGSISANELATNAVTTDKIAANAITAGKIAAGAVVADKLAAGSVTAAKIGAYAVGASHLAAGSIVAGSAVIADAAITTLKIAGNAVTVPATAGGGYSASVNIHLSEPGTIVAIATFIQGAGKNGHWWRLHIGGVQVNSAKPQDNTTGTLSGAVYLSAGTHTVTISCDTHSGDGSCSVTALGAKR